jgi:hypothetical protein
VLGCDELTCWIGLIPCQLLLKLSDVSTLYFYSDDITSGDGVGASESGNEGAPAVLHGPEYSVPGFSNGNGAPFLDLLLRRQPVSNCVATSTSLQGQRMTEADAIKIATELERAAFTAVERDAQRPETLGAYLAFASQSMLDAVTDMQQTPRQKTGSPFEMAATNPFPSSDTSFESVTESSPAPVSYSQPCIPEELHEQRPPSCRILFK